MPLELSQIPKAIEWGEYIVHVPMGRIQGWMDDFLRDIGVDLDPEFQRGHVWKPKNKVLYLEHLLKGGESGRELIWNCPSLMGSTEGKLEGMKDELVIVDGKQRLTAILEFLGSRFKVFGYYFKDYSPEAQRYFTHRKTVIMRINRLFKYRDLLQWYLELNEGHIAHTESELKRIKTLLKNA